MTPALDIILGVLIGVATNIAAWWLLFHWLTPRLRFSYGISKLPRRPTPDNKAKYFYRVKVENSGPRAIVDLEVIARLRLKALPGYPEGLSQIVYVPLDSRGGIFHRIPRVPPVSKSRSRPVLILFPHVQSEFKNINNYPEAIVSKAKRKALTLDDILSLGSGAYLEIFAFGYDEFSGARKLFASKRYSSSDLVLGAFNRRGLDVVPASTFTDENPPP